MTEHSYDWWFHEISPTYEWAARETFGTYEWAVRETKPSYEWAHHERIAALREYEALYGPASLELSGISKRYPGVQALNQVSFECRPGEIHAVLGENGSGKSTLLGIAGGAVVPDQGQIKIMGKVLTEPDPLLARKLGLAVVYQDDSLVRELTVADNLAMGVDEAPLGYRAKREWARKQLAPYDLDISPETIVDKLTPSQRQFLEIVKALATNPKVLLLDEPTSSLDISGVEKLSDLIRRVVARDRAVVYVSHRLHEILELANRVTILRDGQSQGTYEVDDDLSEHDLISLMVGRAVDSDMASRSASPDAGVALTVRDFSGPRFHDVAFEVRRGEILGFAGAEGNGQREAIRALGGLIEATGRVVCADRPVKTGSPGEAFESGILSLSADRATESIFPALGVRENMTVQVLESFAVNGLISPAKERGRVRELVDQLNVITPDLDQPIGGLSGGNQQKTVLARTFLRDAKVVLIDEPTQGVDANARFDIYRAIQSRAADGVAYVVNSSDAMELATICDRVLVFSRGRVIRELTGTELSEENIVSAFLRSKVVATAARIMGTARSSDAEIEWLSLAGVKRLAAGGSRQWWVPLVFLVALTLLVGLYASIETDVFLTKLNIRHILFAAAPLALVTIAQFNVLMVKGFDMSVGSVISLVVVISSFLIGEEAGAGAMIWGSLVCLAVGMAVGLTNGVLIRRVGINAVITTIATLSVVEGVALYLRPTPFGPISEDYIDLMQTRLGFIPVSAFLILAAAIAGDIWLYRTRSGLGLRAAGFREEAAKRNGVRVNFVQWRAYFLSAVIAVVSGYFVSSEVGVGTPTIGDGYTLTSIAAAVLGGAALTGGRGSFMGCVLGALFFTLIINIITLLGLTTGAGVIASGTLTLIAVMLYSGWTPVRRLWTNILHAVQPAARAVKST